MTIYYARRGTKRYGPIPAPPVTPGAPTIALMATSPQVKFSITAGSPAPTTGYSIYRDGVFIITVSSGATDYTDSTGVAGTTYAYTVTAVGPGESAPSNTLNARRSLNLVSWVGDSAETTDDAVFRSSIEDTTTEGWGIVGATSTQVPVNTTNIATQSFLTSGLGEYVMKLSVTSGTSVTMTQATETAVTPGQSYTATYKVGGFSGSPTGQVYIYWLTSGGSIINSITNSGTLSSASMSTLSVTGAAPATAAKARLLFFISPTSTGTGYFNGAVLRTGIVVKISPNRVSVRDDAFATDAKGVTETFTSSTAWTRATGADNDWTNVSNLNFGITQQANGRCGNPSAVGAGGGYEELSWFTDTKWDMTFTIVSKDSGAGPGVLVGTDATYVYFVLWSGTSLTSSKRLKASPFTLSVLSTATVAAYSAGAKIRVVRDGTSVTARVWTGTEPSTWDINNATGVDSAASSPGVYGEFGTSAGFTVDDLVLVGPSVTRTLALTRPTPDSAPAADVVVANLVPIAGGTTYNRTADDTAAATDTLARLLVQGRAPPDSAAATDAVVRTVVQSRPVTEARNLLTDAQRTATGVTGGVDYAGNNGATATVDATTLGGVPSYKLVATATGASSGLILQPSVAGSPSSTYRLEATVMQTTGSTKGMVLVLNRRNGSDVNSGDEQSSTVQVLSGVPTRIAVDIPVGAVTAAFVRFKAYWANSVTIGDTFYITDVSMARTDAIITTDAVTPARSLTRSVVDDAVGTDAPPVGTTVVSDTFTRADITGASSVFTGGVADGVDYGGIVSNVLAFSGNGSGRVGQIRLADTLSTDHFVETDVHFGHQENASGGRPAALMKVRTSSSAYGYSLNLNGGQPSGSSTKAQEMRGTWHIQTTSGGTVIARGYLPSVPAVNGATNRFRLEAVGSTIRAYMDGQLFASITDTTHTTGQQVAIGANTNGAGTAPTISHDNLTTGSLASVTGVSRQLALPRVTSDGRPVPLLADTPSTNNVTSYPSDSFTPTVGQRLVVVVATTDTDTTAVLSSSAGFTFTKAAQATGSGNRRIETWVADANVSVGTAVSQTVTYDTNAADPATGAHLTVLAMSNVTGALAQAAATGSSVASGVPSLSLAGTATPGNPLLYVLGSSIGLGLTPPSGFTSVVSSSGYATPSMTLQVAVDADGASGTTYTWGSTLAANHAEILLEFVGLPDDAIARTTLLPRPISDSVPAADTVAAGVVGGGAALTYSASDSVGLVDSATSLESAALSDSAPAVDTLTTRTLTQSRSATETTVIFDDFTRPNVAPDLFWYGYNGISSANNSEIDTNRLGIEVGISPTFDLHVGEMASNDHTVQAKLDNPGTFTLGIVARVGSVPAGGGVTGMTGYALTTTTTQYLLRRFTGSTFTTIATVNQVRSAGDILKLVVSGTTITGFVNGTQIAQVTDATYSTGNRVGAHFSQNSQWFDDFSAGPASAITYDAIYISQAKSFSDSLGLTDSIQTDVLLDRSDGLGLTDSMSTAPSLDRSVSDSAPGADAVVGSVALTRPVFEGGVYTFVESDDFNRANSTTTLGAGWDQFAVSSAIAGITSNTAYRASGIGTAFALRTETLASQNQWVQATMTQLSSTAYLVLRGSATSAADFEGYTIGISTSDITFFRMRTGTSFQVGPVLGGATAGDVIRAEAVGSELRVYKNGSFIGKADLRSNTVLDYASGTRAGIGVTGSASRLDDYSAGTLTLGAPATDVVSRLRSSSRTANDSAPATDVVATAATTALSRQDVLGLTDSLSVAFVLDRSDLEGLSDSVTRSVDKDVQDSTGLTDSQTYVRTQSVDLSDTEGLVDTRALDVTASRQDVLGLTDSVATLLTLGRDYSDTEGLSDSRQTDVQIDRQDALGLTDTEFETPTTDRTDPANGTDYTAEDVTISRSDSEGLTDSATTVVSFTVDWSDNAGLVDSFTTVVSATVSASDNEGLTDSQLAALDMPRSATDPLNLTDSITTAQSANASASDTEGLSDSVSQDVIQTRSDTEGLSDSATSLLLLQRDFTDSAGLTDSRDLAATRDLSDTLGLLDNEDEQPGPDSSNDTGLRDSDAFDLSASRSDGLGLTDSVSVVATRDLSDDTGSTDTRALVVTVDRSDALGLTDTEAATPQPSRTDTEGLTDSLTADQGYGRSFVDSEGLTDSFTAVNDRSLDLQDSLGLSDSVTTFVARSADLSDTLGLSDTRALTASLDLSDDEEVSDSASVSASGRYETQDDTGLEDSTSYSATRELSDSAGVTDTSEHSLTLDRTDSLGLTDVRTAISTQDRSDTEELSDSSTLSAAASRQDELSLSDSFAVVIGYGRDYSDTEGLSDTQATTADWARDTQDSTGLDDRAASDVRLDRTDTEGASDSVSRVLSLDFQDALGLTDTTSYSAPYAATDSVGLTDDFSASVSGNVVLDQSDLLGLTDSRDLVQTRVQTDALGLTDSATFVKALALDVTDSVGLVDNRQLEAAISRLDTLGLSDRSGQDARPDQADALGLTDQVEYVLLVTRTSSDTEELSDLVTTELVKGFVDGMGLSDAVDFITAYGLDVSDPISLTDYIQGFPVQPAGDIITTLYVTGPRFNNVRAAPDERQFFAAGPTIESVTTATSQPSVKTTGPDTDVTVKQIEGVQP